MKNECMHHHEGRCKLDDDDCEMKENYEMFCSNYEE